MNSQSIHRLFPLGLWASSVLLGVCVLLGCSHDSASGDGASDDGDAPSSSAIQNDEKQHLDGKQDADGGFTHVLTVETEYYLGGPQQARPPDGQFTVGVKVKLIEQAGSYSQVESESGITAYIAADAIQRIEDETGN